MACNVELLNLNEKEDASENTPMIQPDTKSRENMSADDSSWMPYVGVLGGGNYGYALSLNFKMMETRFCVGSRGRGGFDDVDVVSYEEVANKCDVIFLCVPPHVHETVIEPLKTMLTGKVLVDVSNIENKTDPSNALKLQSLLPKTHVVKALNNLSAYYIENLAYGGNKETYVCGNDQKSKYMVMQVLQEIGITSVDRGGLRSAAALEQIPFRFFPGWGTAIGITIATLIPLWFYYYLYIFWYKKDDQDRELNDLPLYISNRLIGWLMFWLLGLTYLPGILAGFIQIYRKTKFSRFPNWLDKWMRCRKQLGLICLLLAGIHGCASTLILGSGEAKYMLEQHRIEQKNNTIIVYQLLSAKNQASLLFATLALALMSILGITSLPSVSARLSWMEWKFVQSTLGFLTLVLGFLHVIVYMGKLWDPDYKYGWKGWVMNPKGIFPTPAWVIPLFPLVVIILRAILLLPGISCYLENIRQGKIGYKVPSAVKNV